MQNTNPTTLGMVHQFHSTFKQPILDAPDLSGHSLDELQALQEIANKLQAVAQECLERAKTSQGKGFIRMQLLVEEVAELAAGLANQDPVEVLDALADVQYVTDGALLTFGLWHAKDAAVAEVHRANMSKLDANGQPLVSDAGRIMKSPLYTPPNLQQVYNDTYAAPDQPQAATA